MYDILLSPMNIGKVTIRNRTVMTAAEMSLGQTNGKPTERLMAYYEERARGGVGLIIPGVTRVNDMGAASTFTQLAMSQDYHIEPMREFARRIHAQGAKLAIQLHHPGRQGYASSINTLPLVIPVVERFPKVLDGLFKCTPLLLGLEEKGICQSVQAPSRCELSEHGATRIHAMSRREIKKLIQDFIDAAARCQKAEVDAVELHGGHGYMIQQFFSPNTNLRTDEYGGSFENRMRFITEIIQGIQDKCGRDYPIIVRMTADECYDRIGKSGKGYDLEYGKRIAQYLEGLGVAALNVTSACYDTYNYWLEPTSFEPGWRAYMAKAIKETVSIPVIAANFMRSPEQAEQQLRDGVQDFIGSARSFICEPHWVKKLEEGRRPELKRCIGCLHCISSFMTNAKVGKCGECALNPAVGHEQEDNAMIRDGEGRRIVVVGAGPAGLMAAETLLRRGFAVTVLEKAARPGGQVNTASACLKKDKLFWCIEDLLNNVKALGGELVCGVEATEETVLAYKPYGAVIATGGVSLVPGSIRGIGGENVYTAPQIILGEKTLENKTVVVAGSGMTGLETVEILNAHGCTVTVVEMADEIAPGTWFQLVDDEMSRIRPHGTAMLTGTKLLSVEKNGVTVQDTRTNAVRFLPCEALVLSLGVRPVNALVKALTGKVEKLCTVGDADKSGTIANAVHSAYDTVRREL